MGFLLQRWIILNGIYMRKVEIVYKGEKIKIDINDIWVYLDAERIIANKRNGIQIIKNIEKILKKIESEL